jgi:hypothetical protein
MNELETSLYFATPLYSITRSDFTPVVLPVFDEYVKKALELTPMNPIHASVMTTDMSQDERLADFRSFILGTAYNILTAQGYKMDNQVPYFHSLWGQEHHKYSDMPEHIHNDSVQLVGFYFLDCPENSSHLVVHDPRYGKRQIDLPQVEPGKITMATSIINFPPQQGMMIFANSWLPHSFSRHAGDKPFKFIHFNISLQQFVPQTTGATIV